MSKNDVQLSKFLSLVLRHKPDEIGITLDEAGWVSVPELLEALNRAGRGMSRETLERLVRTSDKQRFSLSADGTSIRANQGHSVDVELGYEPAEPPEMLFHGTAEKSVESIRREGLQKRKRHHVHLSPTRQTAAAVGSRHGKLVLLEVRAGAMHRDGFAFYRTPNNVWLTDEVLVKYLVFPEGAVGE
jgi:putative RNA 2'-phosphotransferase